MPSIMIHRQLEEQITPLLGIGKAIVIMGARQVGKSTLLETIFRDRDNILSCFPRWDTHVLFGTTFASQAPPVGIAQTAHRSSQDIPACSALTSAECK